MREQTGNPSTIPHQSLERLYEQVIYTLIAHEQDKQQQSLIDYLSSLEQFRIALYIDIEEKQKKRCPARVLKSG